MKETNKNRVTRIKNDFIIPVTIAFNLLLILSFIMVIVFALQYAV